MDYTAWLLYDDGDSVTQRDKGKRLAVKDGGTKRGERRERRMGQCMVYSGRREGDRRGSDLLTYLQIRW